MIFLSFGGGVQSSVMLMLAIENAIDRPDHVIFADTGWEGERTTNRVEWARKQCDKVGIPFHIVSNGNIREDAINSSVAKNALGDKGGRSGTMPWFVDMGGEAGRTKRQCTSEYKLTPIRRKQRELLGYKPRQRIPAGSCEVMLGISTDEARRAAPSRDIWVETIFPLIDPLKMSRADCQSWWDDRFPHIPIGKSSCIGCPNRSDREWLEMKVSRPDDFESACEVDAAIRKRTGMKHDCYLHRSLKPLAEVDLNQAQSTLDLEEEIYCSGGCGL